MRGLQLSIPLDLHELHIESDSLLMFNELLADGEFMSLLGNLVYAINAVDPKMHYPTKLDAWLIKQLKDDKTCLES